MHSSVHSLTVPSPAIPPHPNTDSSNFKAIIDYLTLKRDAFHANVLSVKNIRKHFSKLQPNLGGDCIENTIRLAQQRGLLTITLKDKTEFVQLRDTQKRSVSAASTTPASGALIFLNFGWFDSVRVVIASTPNKAAATRPPSGPRTIACNSSQAHFLPLLKYLTSVHRGSPRSPPLPISIEVIQQHFIHHDPSRYGRRLKGFRSLASQAVLAGLLVSAKGDAKTNKLEAVALVPGAKYSI